MTIRIEVNGKESHMRKPIFIVAATAAVALTLAAPTVANAAPQNGFLVTFTCDNGQTVTAVNPPGHAPWTPGIVVGAGGVLKPVAFSGSNTVYNPDGSVASVDPFSGAQANGAVQQNNPQTMVNCFNSSTYTFDQVPSLLPGQTLVVAVTITGFFTGNA
jgi:hypothetical protein